MLYRGSELVREVQLIVYDEIHYLRDKERGVVWEESIVLAPKAARFAFLSATIPNAREFGDWIAKTHDSTCHIVYTDYRPTPLQHFIFPAGTDGLYMVVDEKARFKEDMFQKAIAALNDAIADGAGGKGGSAKVCCDCGCWCWLWCWGTGALVGGCVSAGGLLRQSDCGFCAVCPGSPPGRGQLGASLTAASTRLVGAVRPRAAVSHGKCVALSGLPAAIRLGLGPHCAPVAAPGCAPLDEPCCRGRRRAAAAGWQRHSKARSRTSTAWSA